MKKTEIKENLFCVGACNHASEDDCYLKKYERNIFITAVSRQLNRYSSFFYPRFSNILFVDP